MDHRPRILFVDDEPAVLDGLRRGLRDHAGGWDMTFLENPGEALERAAAFDLAVCDMIMPAMNGIDLIVAMRRTQPDGVYILLTGAGDLPSAIDAINRAGIFRFFTKPCPADHLAKGIAAGLAGRTAQNSTGMAALDRLALGVIVVDAEARVLFMNQSGRDIVADRDGLFVGPKGDCRAGLPAETRRLHEAIRAVAATGEGDAVAVSRRSPERSHSILVAPLAGANADGVRKVVLYVNDPERHPLPPPAHLAQVLALNPAEARLIHSLAAGSTLEEAAALSGITTGSARTYLKRIFLKTGTSRQVDLVRLVLTLPQIIR